MVARPIVLLASLALLALSFVVADVRVSHAEYVSFTRGTLATGVTNPTALAFGPDGRLYVATETGIRALTLNATHDAVLSTETIATSQVGIYGLAFDPTTPSPITIYASREEPSATDGYEGRVSRYTAPTWTRTDVITGLPSSTPFTNHYTNGVAFNSAGRLFISQGSNTDAGIQTPNYPETPLSAAILYADIHMGGFNGTITYSPSGTPTDDNVNQNGGDVHVFAPGTRNPYGLLVHSNGLVYASDNGPNGPNTSINCTTQGTGVEQNDEFNLIESGNYYGFPNRNRGRFDTRQCTYRAPSLGDGPNYTAPIFTLPAHCSCDGIAEYTSLAFGSGMQGDIILAQFILGNVARVALSPDGRTVYSVTSIDTGFNQPLSVAVGSDGKVYVGEYGAARISYLDPNPKGVGGIAGLPAVATGNAASMLLFAASIAAASIAAIAALSFGRRRRASP